MEKLYLLMFLFFYLFITLWISKNNKNKFNKTISLLYLITNIIIYSCGIYFFAFYLNKFILSPILLIYLLVIIYSLYALLKTSKDNFIYYLLSLFIIMSLTFSFQNYEKCEYSVNFGLNNLYVFFEIFIFLIFYFSNITKLKMNALKTIVLIKCFELIYLLVFIYKSFNIKDQFLIKLMWSYPNIICIISVLLLYIIFLKNKDIKK